MDQPIITEENPQPFIVRVKLLTNQVFQFQVNKQMKVSQFKALVSPKVNVPIQRMRIVFAGKQLLDDKPISQYVSQSGMTVHLIARSAPQPQPQPQTSQNTQPAQQPSTSGPGQVPPNPFGDIMGMMGSIFGQPPGNGPQPQIITSFGNLGNMGAMGGMSGLGGLGGLLGNIGIRVQPGPSPMQMNMPQPTSQPQTQPNTSNVPSTTTTNPQSQSQAQTQSQARISYAQIGQLNQHINSLNIPLDNVTTQQQTMTPEGVIRYLRRLHHQSSRSLLQLNRLLNLAEANNNNTTHLEGFIPVFESLNSSNNIAINCLSQLRQQRMQSTQSSQSQPVTSNQPVVPNTILDQNPLISIVVSQTDQNGNTRVISQTNQQGNNQPATSQPQQQPLPQQPQMRAPQGQQPQPQMNMPMMNPLSMLGGMNLGGIFGQLDSVGGVNGLFGMSLRDMMTENGSSAHNSLFLDLFGTMSGSNLMQLCISKDFKFLKQKQTQIRNTLKQKISQSNEQQIIQQMTDQVCAILLPNRQTPMINNRQECKREARKNIRKYIQKFVQITLSENQNEYDIKVLEISKRAFCQNINIVVKYTTNNNSNVVFQYMKIQAISLMDPILPGISGMFYGLIQRDLLRVYNQFQAEQERRRQMSAQQQKSQQQLIEMIKQVGARDSDKLAEMQHSQSYNSNQKQ